MTTIEETTPVEETSESNLVTTIALIAAGAAGATTLFVAYRKIQKHREMKKIQQIQDAMLEGMDPELAAMVKEQIEKLAS